jgi:hypothetical protein
VESYHCQQKHEVLLQATAHKIAQSNKQFDQKMMQAQLAKFNCTTAQRVNEATASSTKK